MSKAIAIGESIADEQQFVDGLRRFRGERDNEEVGAFVEMLVVFKYATPREVALLRQASDADRAERVRVLRSITIAARTRCASKRAMAQRRGRVRACAQERKS
jgi:hypothetical protein